MTVNGQAYPVSLPLPDGSTLSGVLQFTDASDQPGSGGGGGLPVPFLSGTGPPNGTASAAVVGALYVDTDAGILWIAAETGLLAWVTVGNITLTDSGTSPDGSTWGVNDSTGSFSGLVVQDQTESGTTKPVLTSSFNTLDDGNSGAAKFAAGIGFFGTNAPAAASSLTGALSSVIDGAAKDVLTALVAALAATGQATDNTT